MYEKTVYQEHIECHDGEKYICPAYEKSRYFEYIQDFDRDDGSHIGYEKGRNHRSDIDIAQSKFVRVGVACHPSTPASFNFSFSR
jgi:hypothetical protein